MDEEGRAAAGRTGPFAACTFVVLSPPVRAQGARATANFLRSCVEVGTTTVAVLPVDGDPVQVATWLGEEVRPLLG